MADDSFQEVLSSNDVDQIVQYLATKPDYESKIYRDKYNTHRKKSGGNLPNWDAIKRLVSEKITNSNVKKIDVTEVASINNVVVKVENVVKQSSTVHCKPKFNGRYPTEEDGIDIFYQAKPDFYSSFVQYNTPTETMYKIYNDPEAIWDYKSLLENEDAKEWVEWSDSIHMFIWPREDKEVTKKSLVYVSYSLVDNILSYEYETIDPITRIKKMLGLVIDDYKEMYNKYVFDMSIYGQDLRISNEILTHILTCGVPGKNFDKYFIMEFQAAFNTKSIMKFHYYSAVDQQKTSVLIKSYKRDGYAYLQFTCNEVSNYEQLVTDMKELIKTYLSYEKIITEQYSKFGVSFDYQSIEKEKQDNLSKNLNVLQEWGTKNNVELFSKGYAALCQKVRQPTIAGDDEPDDIEIETFTVTNTSGAPVDVRLKCADNPKMKYPGLNTKNVPCCFANPQTTKTVKGTTKPGQKEKASGGFALKGEFSSLPSNLGFGNIKRMGVFDPKWKSKLVKPENMTLLGCINEILDDPMEIDRLVAIIRSQSKANPLWPYVFSQELYDMSGEEIHAIIQNENFVLQSNLFSHGLEILFGINIFVVLDDNKKLIFEIPRHKNGFIKVRNTMPSILIYKNDGSNQEKMTKHSRYELVTDEDKNPFMDTEKLFDTFEQYTKNFIVDSTGMYQSYLTQLDYHEIFPDAIAQTIDIYGKVSSLLIDTGNSQFSAFVLPSAPLNLPLYDPSVIQSPQLVVVTDYFGEEPSTTSKDVAWFNLGGLNNAVYVTVKNDAVKNISKKVILPSVPTGFENYMYYKRTSEMIQFLVRWLDAEKEDYLASSDANVSGRIELNLKRRLPKTTVTKAEKMQYLEKFTVNLVKNGKLVLPKDFIDKLLLQTKIPIDYSSKKGLYIPKSIYYPDYEQYIFSFETFNRQYTKPKNLMVETTVKSSTTPYVLNIQGSYFIVQPVTDVTEGVNVAKKWRHIDDDNDSQYVLFLDGLTKVDYNHSQGDYVIMKYEDKYYSILQL